MKKVAIGFAAAIMLAACGNGIVYIATRAAATAAVYVLADRVSRSEARDPEVAELSAIQIIRISPYISAKFGPGYTSGPDAWEESNLEPGGNFISVAAGWRMGMVALSLRAELEASRYDSKDSRPELAPAYGASEFNMKTYTYMANFYIDMFERYWIKPYIGMGIGLAHVGYYYRQEYNFLGDTVETQRSLDGLAVGFYPGFSFHVADGFFGDLGIRIVGAELDNEPLLIIGANLGIRYVF